MKQIFFTACISFCLSIPQAGFAQDPYAAMHQSCLTTLKLSQTGCDCVVSEAKSKLDDKQLAMVVASVSGDSGAIQKAQSQLTGDQMANVIQFMTATPNFCKNQ